MIKAILLSMVVASISFFISHSQLLEKLRERIGRSSTFLWQLITCSYCLGHWVAAALLILMPVRLFGVAWQVDFILSWIVISWMAGLQSLAASQLWGE